MAKKKEVANNEQSVVKETPDTQATHEVTIRKTISFSEMMAFVESVVSSCFLGENGEYSPEARHITTYANLVKRYTDMELPDTTNEIYRVIHETGIVRTILENIDREQFDEIEYIISEKVKYLNLVHTNEIMSSMRKMQEQVQKVADAVSGLLDDSVKEDLMLAIQNLSASGITKEDIVKSVLEIREKTPSEGE